MKTRTLSRKDRPDSGGLKENATRNTCQYVNLAGRQVAEAEKRPPNFNGRLAKDEGRRRGEDSQTARWLRRVLKSV